MIHHSVFSYLNITRTTMCQVVNGRMVQRRTDGIESADFITDQTV